MRFRGISGIMGIAVIMGVFTATGACASPSTTLSQTGSGMYVVQGTDLNNVAGIEVVIGYDATTMTNPRVTQGGLTSGMQMVANTNQPGSVRIALVDSYPNGKTGSGPIAEIAFDSLNKSAGKVIILSSQMFDVSAAQIALGNVTTTQQTGGGSGGSGGGSGGSSGGSNGASGGSSGNPSFVGGSLTMPSNSDQDVVKPKVEPPKAETPVSQPEVTPKGNTIAAAVQEPGESQPVLVASLSPSGMKVTIHKSVLERFREFKGEKTPKAFMSLFTAGTVPGIRQEPAVALSDGTAILKIYINLPETGNKAPNFALNGAKLKSLRIEGSDWVVEAMPDKGAYKASVSVMYGDTLTEIPLTLAPRVTIGSSKDGTADEALFARFLTERASGKVPLFDLNGDGVVNYIDDYIYTANYLTMAASKGSAKATSKKTP